jgi:uncharacterized membrane protein YfcA
MHWSVFIILGLIAGVLSGLFGIGGGVLVVPALNTFCGYDMLHARATSLASLLFPVGILGAMVFWRAGLIHWRAAIWLAAGMATTVALGAWLAFAGKEYLQMAYGLFLLYVSYRTLRPDRWLLCKIRKGPACEPVRPPDSGPPEKPWFAYVAIGMGAGVLSGLFGIGGGVVIVPLLLTLLKYRPKRAVATSMGALLFPARLPGVWLDYHQGLLDIPVAAIIAGGLFLGAIVGAKITVKLPPRAVRTLYGYFALSLAVKYLVFH